MGNILKLLIKPSTLMMLVIVGATAYLLEEIPQNEYIQENIPFLFNAQLTAHRLMSNLLPRKLGVQKVAVVEVDDETFWAPPVSGIEPTNRQFLADVAKKAAENGATVIALDIQLKSPSIKPGDDPIRAADNRYLRTKITEIVSKPLSVPVVLAIGLVPDGPFWRREPNIYRDDELPQGVVLGYINFPVDHRQIPLSREAVENTGEAPQPYLSFGQRIAYSYENVLHLSPKLADDWRIQRAQRHNQFVYGGFWRPSEFLRISAAELLKKTSAQALCKDRIVIIGGAWHQYSKNTGPPIDSYESPVGSIPGVYLHANFVEALLSSHFEPGIPRWFAVAFDVVLAALAYVVFGIAKHKALRIGIILLILSPVFLGYLMLVNLGIYLDFTLPLSLASAHLVSEHYKKLREGKPERDQEIKKGAVHV